MVWLGATISSVGVNKCILLTAAIAPRTDFRLGRWDAHLRLMDYKAALRRWLKLARGLPVVLCEGSGADATELVELFGDRSSSVEVLTFDQGHQARGRGVGELRILEHALYESRLIGDETDVFKCSGRYVVTNWQHAFLSDDPSLDCVVGLSQNLQWSDAVMFRMRARYMRTYLFPEAHQIDDRVGHYFEHALARAVLRGLADGYTWRLPAVPPRRKGLDGASGKEVEDSWMGHKGRWARHSMKRWAVESGWLP